MVTMRSSSSDVISPALETELRFRLSAGDWFGAD
jgi:hypothetical protein